MEKLAFPKFNEVSELSILLKWREGCTKIIYFTSSQSLLTLSHIKNQQRRWWKWLILLSHSLEMLPVCSCWPSCQWTGEVCLKSIFMASTPFYLHGIFVWDEVGRLMQTGGDKMPFRAVNGLEYACHPNPCVGPWAFLELCSHFESIFRVYASLNYYIFRKCLGF